ncbi:MAG: hypothetical protein M1818_001089 [Claussenomyces sp. TS43310]|nr:MAG: hypothetical protein M1818_001089 [Claussenomyces sp. TS43310]
MGSAPTTTRYEVLPQDPRSSMASEGEAHDDERLLISPDEPEWQEKSRFIFSFHPTFWMRLILCILTLPPIIIFFEHLGGGDHGRNATQAFLFLALIRNAYILAGHVLRRRILVHLQVRRWNYTSLSMTDPTPKGVLKASCFNLAIDMSIIIGGFVASGVLSGRWVMDRNPLGGAVIVALTAFAVYFLSVIDLGSPGSITISVGVEHAPIASSSNASHGMPPSEQTARRRLSA